MELLNFSKLLATGQIKLSEGEVTLLDQPVAFLPLDVLVTLQKQLEKEHRENMLYFASRDAGVRWFESMHKHFDISMEDVVRWGVKILSLAGWGETTVTKLDSNAQIMQVILRNPAQAKAYGKSKYPVDLFVKGCYASGAQVMFGTACHAIETRCVSLGDPFCEFVARPTRMLEKSKFVARQLTI